MKNGSHSAEEEGDKVEGDDEEEEDEEETIAVTKVNGEDSLVMNASALMNGDDDDDDEDDEHQLSIDTGEPEEEVVRPTIRVAKGLIMEQTTSTPAAPTTPAVVSNGTNKRKAVTTAVTLPVKKVRPNVVESEVDVKRLEEEVKALQWLARRKEQEWDQVIRLLKQKEERLLRSQRNKVMALTETEHMVSRIQPVVVPQQQVLLLSTQGGPRTSTGTRHIAPKPSPAPTLVVKPRPSPVKVTNPTISQATMVTEKGAAEKDKEESKFSAVLEKASRNLAKATKGKEDELGSGKGKEGKKEKVTPACQGCGKKKSEFVCAGCSNRWYCSRECQVLLPLLKNIFEMHIKSFFSFINFSSIFHVDYLK